MRGEGRWGGGRVREPEISLPLSIGSAPHPYDLIQPYLPPKTLFPNTITPQIRASAFKSGGDTFSL